jgi:hypothetical protein
MNYNCGYTEANVIDVLAEGLDMFKLGAIDTDGMMIPSVNLSFTIGTLVGQMSGR